MRGEGKAIIISHDENFRKRVAHLFLGRNYLIAAEASNNAEGVRLVRRILPDILIIDEDMPGLRGFDMASVFAEEELMPVLLLANTITPAMLNKARKTCYFTVLAKPFSDDALIAVADNLINICNYIRRLGKRLAENKENELKRKNLNLAKGMLMAKEGLTEEEAHKAILNESMKKGEALEKTAARLVRAYTQKNLPNK